MSKYETSNMTGTAYWAFVTRPNTTFDPCWSIDLANLTAENKKQLEKQGLAGKIKNKGDARGDFITFKQKVTGANGKEFKAPWVVDKDGSDFTSTIGNGSKVTVQYTIRPWAHANKAGISADLRKVQVLDLVEYNPDTDVVDIDKLPMTQAA